MNEKKTEPQNSQKKKIDVKKTLRNIIVLALVAVISIVGTLAYLSTLSNQETNTFEGSKGIKVQLDEPNFDKEEAKKYTPGMPIPKNPILTNVSTDDTSATEWVAILVTYKYGMTDKTTYGNIKKIIEEIVYNDQTHVNSVPASSAAITSEDYWQLIDPNSNEDTSKYVIYMYCRTLANRDSTTIALFDRVKIKGETELRTDSDIYNSITNQLTLPNFEIKVQGAAIKNEYFQDGTTTPATKYSQLSTTDQNQLKEDLIEVFTNNSLIPS